MRCGLVEGRESSYTAESVSRGCKARASAGAGEEVPVAEEPYIDKEPQVVVTFATVSDAMAVEDSARSRALPGRLAPIPAKISAGCGMAWCAEASKRALLEGALRERGLSFEGIHII